MQSDDVRCAASVTGVEICGFLFQAEDGIRDATVTGVQTCALPILTPARSMPTSVPPACWTGRNPGGARFRGAVPYLLPPGQAPPAWEDPTGRGSGTLFSAPRSSPPKNGSFGAR